MMKITLPKKDLKYIKGVLEIHMDNDPATERVVHRINEALEKHKDKKEKKHLESLIINL